ncbi:MAG TPA: (d)CMP kinase [Candidatus Kryptonia bacterium]
MRKILIAIDGPAGSGKSTTARLVAQKLGYVYVDTGAMYRAITLKVLSSNLDPADEPRVVKMAGESEITLHNDKGKLNIELDGRDVTEAIRSEEVTRNVSLVSSYAGLRKIMVEKQREIGSQKGCVVDGRDIGTVVFPDADLKFFVTADVMERARRRQEELSTSGVELPLVQVVRDLKERDLKDSTRETSPLRKADDAIEIDTTHLTIEEQVHMILNYANGAMVNTEETVRK